MAEKGKRGRSNYKDDPEKVIRLARDGLEKHRKNGNVVNLEGAASSKILGADGEVIGESSLSSEDRRIAGVLIAYAIEAMAEGEFRIWYDSLLAMREMLSGAGWTAEQVIGLCKQIEETACIDCGNPLQGEIARTWAMQTHQEMPVH